MIGNWSSKNDMVSICLGDFLHLVLYCGSNSAGSIAAVRRFRVMEGPGAPPKDESCSESFRSAPCSAIANVEFNFISCCNLVSL